MMFCGVVFCIAVQLDGALCYFCMKGVGWNCWGVPVTGVLRLPESRLRVVRNDERTAVVVGAGGRRRRSDTLRVVV